MERLSGLALLGSTFILCLLFGSSIWVIAKTIERWSFFRARRDDLDRVADDLVARLRHGDFDGADLVLAYSPSIEAAVVRPALEWLDGGPDAVEAVLDAKRAGNRRDLERSLGPLGIGGRQAPWVGLFGTIIGLIGSCWRF
ncbi:MAG TPA: MotA/TolQ/ExbB proton channel family protein [Polyangiaceae bacterium]|nr:MotA/TolQ/ExbB proton channel family protein [Polyangiaceae bacterium]